jgi:hypothetical protein
VPEFDVDAENESRVEPLRDAPIDQIAATLVATRGQVLDLLDRLQPHHLSFRIERSTGPATLGSTLASLSDHDLEHAATLRHLQGSRP